jgi:bifunctional UDP-N-acetylglucosamine pyrophosphorylase/glucosamine-1-phosphate N-acetyltransferase
MSGVCPHPFVIERFGFISAKKCFGVGNEVWVDERILNYYNITDVGDEDVREMLNMVIDEAKKLSPKNITIVYSEELESFKEKISKNHPEIEVNFALQKERKGTAHAVQTGVDHLKKVDKKIGEKVLILYGDTPLISYHTLEKISEKINNFSVCVLGFECHRENAYGRLVVDVNDHIEKIVEFKDASKNEREITLCNSGVMAISGLHISEFLNNVKNDNVAGEFYLTDVVAIAGKMGLKRGFIKTIEEEVLGVNSRFELAQIEEIKQNQIRKKMMVNWGMLFSSQNNSF